MAETLQELITHRCVVCNREINALDFEARFDHLKIHLPVDAWPMFERRRNAIRWFRGLDDAEKIKILAAIVAIHEAGGDWTQALVDWSVGSACD